jgi:hypothetical protein
MSSCMVAGRIRDQLSALSIFDPSRQLCSAYDQHASTSQATAVH